MPDQTDLAGAPTVVLVHGAFADSSSWTGVIERLQAKGVRSIAAGEPAARHLDDSAYVASVIDADPRPRPRRRPLLRRRGDHQRRATGRRTSSDSSSSRRSRRTRASASARSPPTSKDSILCTALVPQQYPTGDGEPAVEFAIDPAKVRDAFAADLPDGAGGRDGRDPAARRGAGVLGAVRAAGLEDAAVLGGGGHRRPGRRGRRRPLDGRARRRARSPRSTART